MRLRALLVPPVLLGLVWAAAIWWPSQRAISSANDQLDQAASQQLLLVTDIDRLNQSSLQESQLEADLAAIAQSIPSEPDIDTFLGTLASAADRHGIRVNLVSPTDILDAATSDPNRPVPAGMSAIAIALEAEGSFDNVMAFTSSLDELSRLVVIDQIGMVALDGDTQLIIVDISLRIFSTESSPEELGQ